MNKKFIFFLIFIFLNNCSFHSNSKFWTKEKKIKEEVKLTNKKNLFVLEDALTKELNPSLKIKLINKYLGKLEKFSKFKFSKIKYFDQHEPEIIFEKENVIFFDNEGTIIKFDKNSDLIWKKNYYSKQEKKINPFLFFSKYENILVIVDTISKYYAIDIRTGKLLWSFHNNAPFISDVKIENVD